MKTALIIALIVIVALILFVIICLAKNSGRISERERQDELRKLTNERSL